MRQREIKEKKRGEEHNKWFNQAQPMIGVKQAWWEKRLTREERSGDSGTDESTADPKDVVVVEDMGGDGVTALSDASTMDVNMVFVIPAKFHTPRGEVAELAVGADRAMFEKPSRVGKHMKPFYIKGHLDDKLMGRMMVDGGTSVNIMPLSVFKKLGHVKGDLKQTNLSLSGFSGKPAEVQGIVVTSHP
jgi:hypothetical protein